MKANINFENVNRLELILKLIDRVNATNYLEIGCDKNQIFNHINCKKKIGVDPVKGGSMRMTSDEFFTLNSDTFDVVFIDGLHHYEQVTRDVNNAIKVLNPNGIIIIHDMLPTHIDETSMPNPIKSPHSPYWLGDVWRLSFDLMNRDDITFKLIAMDCGCGVVTTVPQTPIKVNHENTWEWYCDNLHKLPIVNYYEI
jgi:SAM-dependent methyltransferase